MFQPVYLGYHLVNYGSWFRVNGSGFIIDFVDPLNTPEALRPSRRGNTGQELHGRLGERSTVVKQLFIAAEPHGTTFYRTA